MHLDNFFLLKKTNLFFPFFFKEFLAIVVYKEHTIYTEDNI